LRNGCKFGYPFEASIRSILPLVDEFVIALGPCDDATEEAIRAINDPRIRIVPTQWNEAIRSDYSFKGFVYGQQKSIALFNCTGDWAFYLEGDEVVHEDDLPRIRGAMEQHLNNERVEALYFDYIHFYGNRNTYAWSPAWYRTAPRILRNTIPAWAPKGLFFVVMKDHKNGRYPRAAHAGGTIYHYGWLKTEEQMSLRRQSVARHWHRGAAPTVDYGAIDPEVLRPFTGSHPKAVQDWLPPAEGLFKADPAYVLSSRDRKHRWMMKVERAFGVRFSKKHYSEVG
jgi:glycosyltransferase involved in cell wall biosynthesis